MSIKKWIVAACLVFLAAPCVMAAKHETLLVRYGEDNSTYRFNVYLPAGYARDESRHYPMLFDFHPLSGRYLEGLHDWLSHNGETPWLKTIRVTPAAGNTIGTLFDSSGEQTPLMDFFESALIPAIDQRYRTNDFRMFNGFRYNGTLALSALLNKPDLFDAYFVSSPELKGDVAKLLSKAEQKLSALSDRPRFLLFTHSDSVKEDHQMKEYRQLISLLQKHAPESLEWHYEDMSGRYHMSMPVLSLMLGIERVFHDIHVGLAADSAVSQRGVDAIVDHYQYLSEQKYGFEVSPKQSIETLGFSLIETDKKAGLKVLKQNLALYPEDAYAAHALARAYAQLKDYQKAVEFQTMANDKAQSMLGWHKKRHARYLKEYKALLKEKAG